MRTNKIASFLHDLPTLWERKRFRDRVREEKSKKYLVSKAAKPSRSNALATLVNPKRGFRFASTFYAKVTETGNRHTAAFAGLGVFILLLCGYVVFGSPYFRISPSKVVIERLDSGSDVNVAYRSIEKIYGRPIFGLSSDEVASLIQTTQKNVRSAKVSKLYPNGLKIVLSSYGPEFFTYFPQTERYYGITENGILTYQYAKPASLPPLDIVDPAISDGDFLDYKEGVPSEQMVRIRNIRDALAKSFPQSNVSKFTFFRTERELHVAYESGVRLLFALDGTEDVQFGKVAFWNGQERSPLNEGGISYVDLRIPWKLFVCRNEGECKKNLARIYGSTYRP